MRRFPLLFLVMFVQLNALEFVSFTQALKLQQQTGKVIMIDAVRKECRYCKKMDKEVFNDANMSQWLQERFIPVKMDIEKETLPYGLKVHFTPTFIFIKDHKVIKTIPGSWNIRDFKDLTKEIK